MNRGETTAKPIRVLILDGSAIHTQLLAEALRRDRALDVISLDSPQAVIKTMIDSAIDVLVIGANLEEQSNRGLAILRELRASRPSVRADQSFALDKWLKKGNEDLDTKRDLKAADI